MHSLRWIDEDGEFYRRLQNTVIKKKSITVHYPYHPYYKKSLPIIEYHQKGSPPGYICRVSDTVTLFIPLWMTYPEAEVDVAIQENPRTGFEHLLQTARYLISIDIR